MDEYEEISGMKMGAMVDKYIRTFDSDWIKAQGPVFIRKCYRNIMERTRKYAWTEETVPGRKPRYVKEWAERVIPTYYDEYVEEYRRRTDADS